MRKVGGLGLVLVLTAACTIQVCAQKNAPPPSAPLVLTGAIPLPNVKGRIDHFGLDPMHNRLFVSALGNNTEEIIGISAQTVIHTISGVPVRRVLLEEAQSRTIRRRVASRSKH